MLSENNWLNTDELATELHQTTSWIEQKLKLGEIISSVYSPDIKLKKCIRSEADMNGPYVVEHEYFRFSGGLIDIAEYSKISWRQGTHGVFCADLAKQEISLSLAKSKHHYRFVKSFVVNKSDIVFSRREVNRLKKELGVTNNSDADVNKTKLPYLNPNHKHYSQELAAAVNAWLAIYGDGGTYNPKINHKNQIKRALPCKTFSNSAIERITTLVNPNKLGGATPT